MNRRTAIKRMGMAAMSGLVASLPLTSLTACTGRKKQVMLYFTGTGNCLYVAQQLGDENAEPLSIPQLMKQEQFEIEADEIGLVFPIYGHMPSYMVRQFLEKAKLTADYKFAVLTYGARKCNAVEILDGITRKAGWNFDYIATLIMVDNWLPNFDMNEQMRMDKHIPENLSKISVDISARRKWHEPVNEEERQQHAGFMAFSGLDPEIGFLKKSERSFIVEKNRCIGCGICTNVCPRGNYQLTSQGVKAMGDCEFCFACIQNCPQKAILFNKDSCDPLLANGEKNPNARYRNEHVSLADIKRANKV